MALRSEFEAAFSVLGRLLRSSFDAKSLVPYRQSNVGRRNLSVDDRNNGKQPSSPHASGKPENGVE